MEKGRTQTNGPKFKEIDGNAKGLIPRYDIEGLYISRKEGRGLASIEESVDASIQ